MEAVQTRSIGESLQINKKAQISHKVLNLIGSQSCLVYISIPDLFTVYIASLGKTCTVC